MDTIQIILLTAISLIVLSIVAIALIKRDRKQKSLDIFPFLENMQSALYAFLGLIVFGALSVFFDYWLQAKIHKATSYSYYLFGLLSAVASYFIIMKNRDSIIYVPLIFNVLLLVGLLTDTDLAMLGGMVLSIIGSFLGYLKGNKEK